MPVVASAAVGRRPRAQPAADGDQLRSRTTLLPPPHFRQLPLRPRSRTVSRGAPAPHAKRWPPTSTIIRIHNRIFPAAHSFGFTAAALANANRPQPQLSQLALGPARRSCCFWRGLLNWPKLLPPLWPAAEHSLSELESDRLSRAATNPLHNLNMLMTLQLVGLPGAGPRRSACLLQDAGPT